MAFPVVQATSSGANNAVNSHPVTLPSGIEAGDLLVVFFTTDSGYTVDTPSGWTKAADTASITRRLVIYTKTASGSDTLTIATTPGGASTVDSAYTAYRIVTTNGIQVAITATGSGNVNPNPPSLTPSGGSDTYLWIAAAASAGGGSGVTAYPTNYSANQEEDDTQDFGIASAVYAHEDSSEDPGTFTFAGGTTWVAATVAVEAQTPVTGTFTLLTANSEIIQPAIDFAADASFTLFTSSSSINQPTVTLTPQTVWTPETKPSTTWTNEDKL